MHELFRRRRIVRLVLGAAVAALSAGAVSAGGLARFEVGEEIVNPHVGAFTATIAAIGAGEYLVRDGGGFEPMVVRNRVRALADAADEVIVDANEITRFQTIREGAFDGASVDIYRVTDGRFRRVRRDRVAEGGHQGSGWYGVLGWRRHLPADTTRFVVGRANFNREDATSWWAVRAVDEDGRLSPLSAPVRVVLPLATATDPERPELERMKRDMAPGVGAPRRPENLTSSPAGERGLALSWDPSPGAAGYVLFRTETDPDRHIGYRLVLEGGAGAEPVRAGDMVIISKKYLEPKRTEILTDRVWNDANAWPITKPGMIYFWPGEHPAKDWRFAPHAPDTPVTDPGETYLEMTLREEEVEGLRMVNHSGLEQYWYEVLEPRPYRVSFWARSETPSRIGFRLSSGLTGSRPVVFETGPEWRRYETEFTPVGIQKHRRAEAMVLELVGPNVFNLDNIRIHRADVDHLTFRPEEKAELRRSGMAALRTHEFGKVKLRSFDLEQLTNAGGAASIIGGNTLHQTLEAIESVGMDPWLQLPMHFSPEEWLGFVEYMQAPFDPAIHDPAERPWAAKRYAQGRPAPWAEAFDRVLFELANETWNRLFAPWTFTRMTDEGTGRVYNSAESYGLFHDFVVETMRSSPYWAGSDLEAKFESIIGGWFAQPYGKYAARASETADYMTIVAYNGGWDEGQGPPSRSRASYFNVLNQVTQTIERAGVRHEREVAEIARERGRPLGFGSYEAGPGYTLNGLNGWRVTPEQADVQEEVMKSQAAGVATLDTFLTLAAHGATLQNFFTFSDGRNWSSHARWFEGGHAYPSWEILGLFNREGTGEMLDVATLDVPRADLKPVRSRPAVSDAPLVAAYATRRSDRLIVFVLSRRVPDYPQAGDDGYTEVRLRLPIESARSATLYRMAGPFDAHTVDRDDVKIETVPLGAMTFDEEFTLDDRFGVGPKGVPPGSVFVYVFETE